MHHRRNCRMSDLRTLHEQPSKVANRRSLALAYRAARLVALSLGRDPRDKGTYRLAEALARKQ